MASRLVARIPMATGPLPRSRQRRAVPPGQVTEGFRPPYCTASSSVSYTDNVEEKDVIELANAHEQRF